MTLNQPSNHEREARATELARDKEARAAAAQVAASLGARFTENFAAELHARGLSLYGLAVTLGVSVSVRLTRAEWLRVFNYLTLPQAIQGKAHTPVARLKIVARALEEASRRGGFKRKEAQESHARLRGGDGFVAPTAMESHHNLPV